MFKKIVQFFKEVRAELRKVSWPNREQVISSTGVVLITVLAVATFLWVIDMSLQKMISQVIR